MKGIVSSSDRGTKSILRKPTLLSFLSRNKSESDSVDIVMKQKYGDSDIEENDEERIAVIVNRTELQHQNTKIDINPYIQTKRLSPRGVNEFEMCPPTTDRNMSISSKEISHIEGGDDDIHFCHISEIDSVNGSNVIDMIEIGESDGAELREIVAGMEDSTVLCHSDAPCSKDINQADCMMSLMMETCSVGSGSLKDTKRNVDKNLSIEELEKSIIFTSEAIDTLNISAGEYLSQGKTIEAMGVYAEAVKLAKSELQQIKRKMKRHSKEKNTSNSSGILELDDAGSFINDSDFLLNSSTFISPRTKTSRNNDLESHYESLSLSIAHILNNLGVVQEMCEQYDKALRSCRESLKTYRDVQSSSDSEKDEQAPYITRTINNISQILRASESHGQRKKLNLDAQHLLNKFHQLNGNQKDSYADLEKSFLLNESLQLYKELYRLECSTLGTSHPNLAKTLHSMGKLRWILLQHEKMNVVDQNATNLRQNQHAAVKEILHARKLVQSAHGPNHPMMIFIIRDLAKFYHELEILPNALDLYEEALSLERRYSSKESDSIEAGLTLANIGDIHLRLGDVSRSIDALREAVAIFKQNSSYSYYCHIYDTLGKLYFTEVKDYPKAVSCFYESLHALLKKADDIILHERGIAVNKDDHNLQVACALSNLGMVYCVMEEYVKGISCYNEALQIRITCNTSDQNPEMKANLSRLISDTLFSIGEAHFADRQFKKSISTYKSLLKFTRKSFVDRKNYNIPTAKCLEKIGYIHVELKEKEESKICWNEALRLLKEMDRDATADETKLLIDRITNNMEKVKVSSSVSNKELNLLPPSFMSFLPTMNNVECIYEGQRDSLQHNKSSSTITLSDYDKRAQIFLQKGDTKKALKYLFKALDKRRQKQHKQQLNDEQSSQDKKNNNEEATNMNIARNLFLIGIVYQYQEDNVSALIFFNEAMRIYKDIFHFDDDHSLVVAVQNKMDALSNGEI